MSRQERITQQITTALQPTYLEVINQSHLHQGHAGHSEEGDSHFLIRISAPHLAGKTRVAQHQAIYQAVQQEINAGLHALAIEIIPTT